MPDPRFWVLQEALSSYASDPDDPPVRDDDVLQAAVSLILRGGSELEVLLIKRAAHEHDPWSGHMALPGGRRDPTDRDLVETAVRETREETGVDLEAAGHRLGQLETVAPVSRSLPRLTISPFVFGVAEGTPARVASREVAAVHWVTVAELASPATAGEVRIELPDGSRTFPCLHVRNEVVWGLTYRILTDFLEVYPEGKMSSAGS